jgi:hypothetical protein
MSATLLLGSLFRSDSSSGPAQICIQCVFLAQIMSTALLVFLRPVYASSIVSAAVSALPLLFALAAMDRVVRFMADTNFNYDRDTSKIVSRTPEEEAARASWIQSLAALVQARKQTVEERMLWLQVSNRYLAMERVSPYTSLFDRSKFLLFKHAAGLFYEYARESHEEIVRLRVERRRFSYV